MVFFVMVKEFFDSIPEDILDRSKHLDLVIRSSLCHQAIDDVLSKTVLNGGKRLRPLLTFLTGNLFRVDLDKLTPYARASELVHAASLSHDDVIDNATLRRGAPSINILASNKKAVLAGDYLLSKVIVDLCAANDLELVSRMSKVIKDLSEGEWLQLDLLTNRNYSREAILEVAKMKTSSVMSYCTVAPAILAAESKEVIGAASDFGVHLGIAFQLIDDTLDFSKTSDKDALLDLENNVVNAVFYEYLESRSGLIERFKMGEDLNKLINLNEIQESVDIVVKRAHEHLEMALNNLSIIEKSLKQKYPEKEIDEAVEYLRLIVAFLVLRKN